MSTQFGRILKTRRKSKNMTLNQLAQEPGLSSAYLSLLERNMNSPTVENLNRVCAALDLTLADLIEEANSSNNIVVKSTQRKLIFEGSGYLYEAASTGGRQMECLVMTISDTSLHVSNAHVADEIGYIVSGSITINVSGVEYPLSQGDCIYIEANQHHSYYKTSKEDCVSIWVYSSTQTYTPPVLKEDPFAGKVRTATPHV